MTNLQSKSGLSLFTALVTVAGVELQKQGNVIVAFLNGEKLGTVDAETVVADGKKLKVASLKPAIDVTALVGKDPTTLTHEELVQLTLHLQSLASAKVGENAPVAKSQAKAKDEATEKEVVKVEKKTKKTVVVEKSELPEGFETYEDLAELGSKELWKDIVKGIASELEGISSRSKKDEMLEAAAKYFGLTPAEEEEEDEEEEEADALPESMDDEDEEEDEDDDLEDEDEDEDDEDEEDEDSDEDDEDEDDDSDEDDDEDEDDEEYDEEDEDEEDEDEVTEKDVDALFKAGNKAAIVEFCRTHGISIPKKKLSADKVKQIIKEALFGEE